MVKLQVPYAFVQPGKQGYSLLESRRSLMAPHLNRKVFVETGVAVAMATGAEASSKLGQSLVG
jgi:hypothetical protein